MKTENKSQDGFDQITYAFAQLILTLQAIVTSHISIKMCLTSQLCRIHHMDYLVTRITLKIKYPTRLRPYLMLQKIKRNMNRRSGVQSKVHHSINSFDMPTGEEIVISTSRMTLSIFKLLRPTNYYSYLRETPICNQTNTY